MNLAHIKNYILSKKGKRTRFRYNGSRNQIEEFYGIIDNVYPAIFTIITDKGQIKSFSYNDVIISVLKIY